MNTKNVGIAAGIAVIVVIIAWFSFSNMQKESVPAVTETSTTKEFTLEIVEKKIIGTSSTLTVNQGDTVVINITSDEAEEFHVHAYDDSVELEPGVKATLSFVADASGRFPFELEESKTEIGAIEVLP